MKLNQEIETSLNNQTTHEWQSFYNYLGIAAWLETTPFTGFASWMRKQSTEEHAHAMKFFDYIVSREGHVIPGALTKPKVEFKSPLNAFKQALDYEEENSKRIRELYALADKLNDYESVHFLGWFLDEQIEEEKSVKTIIQKLEWLGDNPAALLSLDVQAASRVS